MKIQGADHNGFTLILQSVTEGGALAMQAADQEKIVGHMNSALRWIVHNTISGNALPTPSDERKALLAADAKRHRNGNGEAPDDGAV